MTRAYLRLDPDFAERKRSYPDGPYRALIDVFCAAEYEPKRGTFRNMAILRAVIGRSAKFLPYLFAHHDLKLLADDKIEVVGWTPWQEGNWQVAERMKLVRENRAERHGEPPPEERTPAAVRTANWRLRNRIFERDDYTCRYCGKSDYPREWLILEHVQPAGPSTEENLVTACRVCNKLKGGRSPEEAGMLLRDVTHHVTHDSDVSRGERGDVTVPSERKAVSGKPLAVGGQQGATESWLNVELWAKVQKLGEELTGVAHGLPNPYSGYGAQALSQALDAEWVAFEAAYRRVAAVYGRPTPRQLVFDAETILRPTGRAAERVQAAELDPEYVATMVAAQAAERRKARHDA